MYDKGFEIKMHIYNIMGSASVFNFNFPYDNKTATATKDQ